MNVYHQFNYKGHYIEIHSPLSTVHTISIDKRYTEEQYKITVYKTFTDAKTEAKKMVLRMDCNQKQ